MFKLKSTVTIRILAIIARKRFNTMRFPVALLQGSHA